MRDLLLVTFNVVEHPRYKEAINRRQPLFPLLSFFLFYTLMCSHATLLFIGVSHFKVEVFKSQKRAKIKPDFLSCRFYSSRLSQTSEQLWCIICDPASGSRVSAVTHRPKRVILCPLEVKDGRRDARQNLQISPLECPGALPQGHALNHPKRKKD